MKWDFSEFHFLYLLSKKLSLDQHKYTKLSSSDFSKKFQETKQLLYSHGTMKWLLKAPERVNIWTTKGDILKKKKKKKSNWSTWIENLYNPLPLFSPEWIFPFQRLSVGLLSRWMHKIILNDWGKRSIWSARLENGNKGCVWQWNHQLLQRFFFSLGCNAMLYFYWRADNSHYQAFLSAYSPFSSSGS